jgi:hypothetical protein
MKQKAGPQNPAAGQVIKDIRSATRKHHSAEDKIRIVLEGLRGEDSIAALCRREGIAESLVAATLAADPIVEGGHRVVFLSSDDEDAIAPVAALAKQLGFAPVKLGKLNEGGALVHARGRTWGQLIFQDLFKKEQ